MRARDLGLTVGLLPCGPANAITDVEGVRVGHANHDADHSGVTVVVPHAADPFEEPYPCATGALNGAGEIAGMAQIEEWGCAETPVFLTGTGYVGAVWAAAARLLARRDARIGRDGGVVIPVVAECDPSEWCDMRDGPEPDESLVARALDGADAGAVAEGQVGAGVGMETFGFAGGIGTASRVTPLGHVLGVLVLSNFGWPERLTVAGRTLAPELLAPAVEPSEGSCVCLVATDAPLSVHQLQRLARRPFLGLARLGSFGSNGSGEVSIAWSTQNRLPRRDTSPVLEHRTLRDEELNPLFAAAMEATEEAVLNALCAARALRGFDGRTLPAFPARRAAALAGAGS